MKMFLSLTYSNSEELPKMKRSPGIDRRMSPENATGVDAELQPMSSKIDLEMGFLSVIGDEAAPQSAIGESYEQLKKLC